MSVSPCQGCKKDLKGQKPVKCIRTVTGCNATWCTEVCRRKTFKNHNASCEGNKHFKYDKKTNEKKQESLPIAELGEALLKVDQTCSLCGNRLANFTCCKNVAYCSKTCQSGHRGFHRSECENMSTVSLDSEVTKIHIFAIASEFVTNQKLIEIFMFEKQKATTGPIWCVEYKIDPEKGVYNVASVEFEFMRLKPEVEKRLKKKLRYVEDKDKCFFFVFIFNQTFITYTVRIDLVFRDEKNAPVSLELLPQFLSAESLNFELLLHRLCSKEVFTNFFIFSKKDFD